MAVPARKVSKTSGRMRRTHYKIEAKTVNVAHQLNHTVYVKTVELIEVKKLLLKKLQKNKKVRKIPDFFNVKKEKYCLTSYVFYRG